MKIFLLIFFFPLIVVLGIVEGSAQTNVYHPFPEDTATWVVDFTSNSCQGYCSSSFYEMHGDTLINSISYNKLYMRGVYFYYISPPPYPVIGYNASAYKYKGAIRQDVINKKIYYRDSTMTSDKLLYDFDLKIDDTLPPLFINELAKPTVVTGFDSILINGNYHKVLLLNHLPKISSCLIEGIGSSNDLFRMRFAADGNPMLACFDFNAMMNGGGTFNHECEIYLGNLLEIQNTEKSNFSFKILPNPSTGIFTLSSSENFSYIEISDMLGNVVLNFSIKNSQTEINISSQPKGIYIVKISDEKGNFGVRKIIIQ